jgi:hypothetical protein
MPLFLMILMGQCHEMDIFLRSKYFNQYFLRMLMVFKIFQRLFTTLYIYKLFICFFEITY